MLKKWLKSVGFEAQSAVKPQSKYMAGECPDFEYAGSATAKSRTKTQNKISTNLSWCLDLDWF